MSGSLALKERIAAEFARSASVNRAKKRTRTPPLSLRLSKAERARLEKDANGKALGTYIKERVFEKGSESHSRTLNIVIFRVNLRGLLRRKFQFPKQQFKGGITPKSLSSPASNTNYARMCLLAR